MTDENQTAAELYDMNPDELPDPDELERKLSDIKVLYENLRFRFERSVKDRDELRVAWHARDDRVAALRSQIARARCAFRAAGAHSEHLAELGEILKGGR